ncbi:MAG: glycosyltransferase [Phycisphaerales bacterium]
MRILMLGWEFPPFIAGGLGVACYGLTKALDRQGHQVIFILPKPVDRSRSSHVKMLSPFPMAGVAVGGVPVPPGAGPDLIAGAGGYAFQHTTFFGVPATFANPYPGAMPFASGGSVVKALPEGGDVGQDDVPGMPVGSLDHIIPAAAAAPVRPAAPRGFIGDGGGAGHGYGTDLVGDAERYARLCVTITRREQYDVIHAHDWLTYPAAIALAKVTGKPMIVQVHSTEFDRAGNNVNQRVYDIERAGMHAADRVVCVSQLTKSICVRRYGVSPDKVDVVYNGIERESQQPQAGSQIEEGDKIVLFLGRITMQKGPEYFIAAAQRVLEKLPHVKFVLAGSGDMALRMIDMAASMGIGSRVLFTGFLRGNDVERVFQMADCYVMPSVSEPFGIAALEAISHDVPVILSKTSGASEVLQHVLKVDFWDIDEMANKIVAVLRHPPLSQTLRHHGQMELHRLTWDEAARRCIHTYEGAIAARTQQPAIA